MLGNHFVVDVAQLAGTSPRSLRSLLLGNQTLGALRGSLLSLFGWFFLVVVPWVLRFDHGRATADTAILILLFTKLDTTLRTPGTVILIFSFVDLGTRPLVEAAQEVRCLMRSR